MMRDEEQLATLVAEIAAFLQMWQVRLSAPAAVASAESCSQADVAQQLGRRAAELGVGGLAHHLARCSEALRTAPLNMSALREGLRAVSEISWQLRQEMNAAGGASRPRVAPPPPLSAPRESRRGDAPEPPPRLTAERAPAMIPAALASSLVAPPLLSSSVVAASREADASDVAPPQPPLLVQVPLPVAPPPERAASVAVAPPAAPNGEPPRRPAGLFATLFGPRGKGSAQEIGKRGPAPAVAPVFGSSLFGFRAGGRAGAAPPPPPLVSAHGALPLLPGAAASNGGGAGPRTVNADLSDRLRQIRPLSRPTRRRARPPAANREGASAPAPPLRRAGRVSWGIVLLITVPVGLLLGNAFLIVAHRLRAQEPERVSMSLGAVDPSEQASATDGAASAATQQLQALTTRIHDSGGAESPELRALLDAEAEATYRALAQNCGGSAACESQRLARELLTPRPLASRAPRPSGAPPRWLAGLTIPAIGAQDHPEVQRWLEYYTSHSVGRELFQTMLFRCGAHQDLIDKALIHHGLPLDLMAVVLTESACVADAESAVGARGLWQFMAPTARAYHLQVQEGVVDERLSPVKSTDAAVRYLADLYRKMGSWEMAFASYNAGSGPFRMLARLQQTGASATFWDLAEAQLIPEETARYVPRIQAYALILANLRHFDFSTAQLRTAEETADLEVPSRARLGQVARAAGTSVSYLRALNPDLVGTVIPSLPGNRFVLQVPKASAFRAREMLGQFLQEQLDLCVSSAFDWGRERFTAEMQAKCTARRSRARAAPASRSPAAAR